MKRSSETKRKLNPEQEKMIVEIVTNKTPDQVGFECRKSWTIELIRQLVIKEFNELCVIEVWPKYYID